MNKPEGCSGGGEGWRLTAPQGSLQLVEGRLLGGNFNIAGRAVLGHSAVGALRHFVTR